MKILRHILFLLTALSGFLSGYSQIAITPEKELIGEEDSIAYAAQLAQWRHRSFVPYRHIVSRPVLPDTADLKRLSHKAFWRAGAEVVGFNLGLWSFDRFVLHGEYSYISWESIKNNFKHGFEWDNDYLNTNMFAHPYTGSLYFNAGRSNGFNFWQSELFAIGGSAMWEMFMEKEYPSTNDIIATPIGGAAIGEVLYRTSDLILDDRATGGARAAREIAGFIINPVREFTRIVTGRAWKVRPTSGRQFGIPAISVDLSLGGRYLSLIDNGAGHHIGAAAEINIEYGDRYAESTKRPYDYFSFLMELQGMKSQPILSRMEIKGRLLSKQILDKRTTDLCIGMFQHFDFFDSDTIRPQRVITPEPCTVPYKFGTPACVGGGAMLRFAPLRSMMLDASLHVNAVALAGILTDFYRDYHRNYNWGSGFSIKAGLNWGLTSDKLSVHVANQFYQIYTWKGYDESFDWSLTPEGAPVDVQGDASHSSFNHFETSVVYKLREHLYLTGGLDLYTRRTKYDKMEIKINNSIVSEPCIMSRQLGMHLMLTYKL